MSFIQDILRRRPRGKTGWITLALLILTAVGQSCEPEGDLRLSHSDPVNLPNAGRVEICMGGVWGTIAADSVATPWSEKNAQVACIQLGFSGALNVIIQHTVSMPDSSVPVHLANVNCSGAESTIAECTLERLTQSSGHENDVYIVCRPRITRYSDVHPAGVQSGDIRLFGDTRNGRGAVQIYTVSQGWQGICPDSSWTNSDAATICQDLGYQDGSVAAPVFSSVVPGGQSPSRLIYDVSCPSGGSGRDSIFNCPFNLGSGDTSNCDSNPGLYAAVQCSLVPDESVRLIGGSHSQEGIVEIAYNGRWGMVCDEGFTSFDIQTVCDTLGYGRDNVTRMRLTSSSAILGYESSLRPIWLTKLMCTSEDHQLPNCVSQIDLIGYADCTEDHIAAVHCGDPGVNVVVALVVTFVWFIFSVMICSLLFVIPKCCKDRNLCLECSDCCSSWSDGDCCCCNDCGIDSCSSCTSYCNSSTLISLCRSACCRNGSSAQTPMTWQPPRRPTVVHPTADTTLPLRDDENGTSFNLELRQVNSESAPSINDDHLVPEVNEAPPPSYQASANYPTFVPPPPYPGRPHHDHSPSLDEDRRSSLPSYQFSPNSFIIVEPSQAVAPHVDHQESPRSSSPTHPTGTELSHQSEPDNISSTATVGLIG